MVNSMLLHNQEINKMNEISKKWQSSDSQAIVVAVAAGIIIGILSSLYAYVSPFAWVLFIFFALLCTTTFSLFFCFVASPKSRIGASLVFNTVGMLANIILILYHMGSAEILLFLILSGIPWVSGATLSIVVSLIRKTAKEDLTTIKLAK